MTDPTLTGTALIEALALHAGVTTDQARTILEAAGVKVQPEKPALPTEPGDAIIATEVRGVKYDGPGSGWKMFLVDDGGWISAEPISGYHWHKPHRITAWTEAVVVPAGEKIDPADVRVGDRVRVKLDSGDEATFTVTGVAPDFFTSEYNVFYARNIRAVHLLDREGEG